MQAACASVPPVLLLSVAHGFLLNPRGALRQNRCRIFRAMSQVQRVDTLAHRAQDFRVT